MLSPRLHRFATSALLLGLAGPAAEAAPERPPALHAVRTAQPPRIDGRLDEPAWVAAALIDDFTMQLPKEGIPSSEKTLVRVLYDDENLYVGITCFDSNPAAIRSASLVRDDFAVSFGEQIAFAIDPTDSGRDGFWFSTNPGGAQLDSQVFDEGRVFDPEWDAIWESVGRIDGQGWTTEIRLPFFNLRFVEGSTNTMRINFFRAIRHKNEEDYAPAIPRNYAGSFSFSIGRPVVFTGIRRGLNLAVKPYALASASSEYLTSGESDVKGSAGIDAKWGVTTDLAADFTLHPDFAQAEADEQQLNFTRFPLFFPEKREFFLENAGLFAFGLPGETAAFFSRRIGLDASGRPVPLRGGVRLTGRSHGWSVGVLDAGTEETAGLPQTNFAVARLRRDVGKRSSIGTILTDREAGGAGGGNRVAGADAHLVFGEDTFLDAFVMGSRTSGDGGDGVAGNLAYSRMGDRWRFGGYTGRVDEGFVPGVGFVQRTGIQYGGGSLAFRPRPASLPRVRQFEFLGDGRYVQARVADETLDGRVLDRTWAVAQNTELESGDRFGVSHRRVFERIAEEFPISPEGVFPVVLIPPGDYEYDRTQVELNTWPARPVSASAFVSFGTFLGGRRTATGGTLTARFTEHLSISSNYTHNQFRVPLGEFDTRLWITRVKVAFTPELFGGVLIQWNDSSDDLDFNLRLDFIHTPGSDLFLVYNESLNTDRDTAEPRSNRREGIVKLTYLFQF